MTSLQIVHNVPFSWALTIKNLNSRQKCIRFMLIVSIVFIILPTSILSQPAPILADFKG